jgi:hypothetical protein
MISWIGQDAQANNSLHEIKPQHIRSRDAPQTTTLEVMLDVLATCLPFL